MRAMKLFLLLPSLLSLLILPAAGLGAAAASGFEPLFGFQEISYTNLDDLPQWLTVLRRHPREDIAADPDIASWLAFLDTLKNEPPLAQMHQVNGFANQHRYILDRDNYGADDYWAIVREFLHFDGDCEDFAITKYFSLRLLGFAPESLRLVVLQDTNLKIAHAILAVSLGNDIFILDNQTPAVVSHKEIIHYTPLYSVNEQQWWLHIPPLYAGKFKPTSGANHEQALY